MAKRSNAMKFLGKAVEHAIYGKGIITNHESKYVTIKFDAMTDLKEFPYPSCFKSNLKILDDNIAQIIQNDIIKNEFLQQRESKALVSKHTSGSSIQQHPRIDSVSDFCNTYISDLRAEIEYIRKDGGKRQQIFDGKRVEAGREGYIYNFESRDALNYPDGTQITIYNKSSTHLGYIINCEEFNITISSEANLGSEPQSIEFSADPWRLLYSLIERLQEINHSPSVIATSLICKWKNAIDFASDKLETGQPRACAMAHSQPITFIWGPPGTGKTTTLAKIAREFIEKNKRVLMLSYSNVSVDSAILKLAHDIDDDIKNQVQLKNEKLINDGTIVRYGYPKDEKLLNKDCYLTTYNLVIKNHPELAKERDELRKEKENGKVNHKLNRDSPRLLQINERLTQIKEALSNEEKLAVKRALFVATTVSKAVVDTTIYKDSFDVVIFDEASMAYIPQVVFSASLAQSHFICMGDFQQLPPIVQHDDTSILNDDIFNYCGIISAVSKSGDLPIHHRWLCLLDKQYRMHPDIANFVKDKMYCGRLETDKSISDERDEIAKSSPIPGHAIGLADLTSMHSVCIKTPDNSRVNILSALISFSLAVDASKAHGIGIITPYRAQAQLLRAMAKDARDASIQNDNLKKMTCATVHQFQGSENDVIIYDAVDCHKFKHPSKLITNPKQANKLFNVAITRARGKFIAVTDVDYMKNAGLSDDLLFKKFIDMQRNDNNCVLNGRQLAQKCSTIHNNVIQFFDSNDSMSSFIKDIESSQELVRIELPDCPDNSAILEMLSLSKMKIKNIRIRAENKDNIPSSILELGVIENPCVHTPIAIIDKRIIWYGIPSAIANLVSNNDSLKTQYRPVIRFDGQCTASSVIGFLKMDDYTDHSKSVSKDSKGKAIINSFSSYIMEHIKCNRCGKPMKLAFNKVRGLFFLSCSGYPRSCDNTLVIDCGMVDDYLCYNDSNGLLCPKCGGRLISMSGKFGIYVECLAHPRHTFKLSQI